MVRSGPALDSGRRRKPDGLALAASQGRFALQTCRTCQTVQYPPRDLCGRCLADTLIWTDVPQTGELLAETVIRVTFDPAFERIKPWRIGTVRLDCGPFVIAHMHGGCRPGMRVRLSLKIDSAGRGSMFCLPAEDRTDFLDRQLQEFVLDPAARLLLLLGGTADERAALAEALDSHGGRKFATDLGGKIKQDFKSSAECRQLGATIEKRGFRGVLFLVRSRSDLEKAADLRETLRFQRIRVFRCMPAGNQPITSVADAVLHCLEIGIEDIEPRPGQSEFLRPSSRFPGLDAYDD